MSDTMIVYEGEVTRVERSTEGYGESERTVGVDVTMKSKWPNDAGNYGRSTTVHLPTGYHQPSIGDRIQIVIGNLSIVDLDEQLAMAAVSPRDPDTEPEEGQF